MCFSKSTNAENAVRKDDCFDYFTAQSINAKKWTHQTANWADYKLNFLDPSHVKRAACTLAEYDAMDDNTRADIKRRTSAPIFYGMLNEVDGIYRRRAENVRCKRVITLDVEHITPDQFELLKQNFAALGIDGLIHSTFRHRPDAPRVRLMAWTSREMTADEYAVVVKKLGRQIAEDIHSKVIDKCSEQANQAMYAPAALKDAEILLEGFDGEALDPDKYLEQQNILTASASNTETPKVKLEDEQQKIIQKGTKKNVNAGDPREYNGARGAFNKAFDISAALAKFAPGKLIWNERLQRYSFSDAESSPGCPVYSRGDMQQAWMYSYHSHHALHDRLVDPFTLIQYFKFGHLDYDDDADDKNQWPPKGKRTTDLVSYQKMLKLCEEDEQVDWKAGRGRSISAPESKLAKNKEPWVEKLIMDTNTNRAKASEIANIGAIFRNDSVLKGLLARDLLTGNVVLTRIPPWRINDKLIDVNQPIICDKRDETCIREYINNHYTIGRLSCEDIRAMIGACADENPYHPVANFLQKLPPWDGVKRLDTMLIDNLGAVDNALTREASVKWMVAAVMRAKVPGSRFDSVPILKGDQGIGKSRFIADLGGQWSVSGVLGRLDDKDTRKQYGEHWIVEFPELTSILARSSTSQLIKAFLSAPEDCLRLPYASSNSKLKRSYVCCGTTNDSEFLLDSTGNRRFWIIPCSGPKYLPMDPSYREQLWAEALHLYNSGIVGMHDGRYFFDLSDEAAAINNGLQQGAMMDDGLEADIRAYLNEPVPGNWEKRTLEQWRQFRSARPYEKTPEYFAARQSTVDSEHAAEPFGTYSSDFTAKYIEKHAEGDFLLYPKTRVDAQEIMIVLGLEKKKGMRGKIRDVMNRIAQEPQSGWEFTGRQRHGFKGGTQRVVDCWGRSVDLDVVIDRRDKGTAQDGETKRNAQAARRLKSSRSHQDAAAAEHVDIPQVTSED